MNTISTPGFSTATALYPPNEGGYPRKTSTYPRRRPLGRRLGVLQEPTRNDHPLDLAGALVDARDARVAVGTLDPELAHVAHAAMDLHRRIGDAAKHLRREELRHRGALRDALAAVGARCRVVHHESRRVDLRGGVGEHPLDPLIHRDRFAELLALLG